MDGFQSEKNTIQSFIRIRYKMHSDVNLLHIVKVVFLLLLFFIFLFVDNNARLWHVYYCFYYYEWVFVVGYFQTKLFAPLDLTGNGCHKYAAQCPPARIEPEALRFWCAVNLALFIIMGTRQQLAKVTIDRIIVGQDNILPVLEVTKLDCWFGSKFGTATHINKICSASFFRLHNIWCIRKFLTVKLLIYAHFNLNNLLLDNYSSSNLLLNIKCSNFDK